MLQMRPTIYKKYVYGAKFYMEKMHKDKSFHLDVQGVNARKEKTPNFRQDNKKSSPQQTQHQTKILRDVNEDEFDVKEDSEEETLDTEVAF